MRSLWDPITTGMTVRTRPWLVNGVARAAGLTVLALLISGCAQAAEPVQDPRSVGDQTVICAGRVEVAQAEGVIARQAADLLLTSDFTDADKVGGCSLQTPDGAVLDIQVFNDPDGSKLARELQELASLDNYSGDGESGVAGQDNTTTSFAAVDAKNYVRVIGLAGSNEDQRTSALTLAKDVAAFSEKLK